MHKHAADSSAFVTLLDDIGVRWRTLYFHFLISAPNEELKLKSIHKFEARVPELLTND